MEEASKQSLPPPATTDSTLRNACREGNLERAKSVVELIRLTANSRDDYLEALRKYYNYSGALTDAYLGGHARIVNWLCIEFAITAEEDYGARCLALRYACLKDSHERVRKLIEDLNFAAEDIRTSRAVFCSAMNPDPELTKWLIVEFDIDAEYIISGKALARACMASNFDLAKWLIDRFGIGVDHLRSNNNHVLRTVCGMGKQELVQWLVWRFNLTAEDIRAGGALHFARKHSGLANWLREKFGFTEADFEFSFRLAQENVRIY